MNKLDFEALDINGLKDALATIAKLVAKAPPPTKEDAPQKTGMLCEAPGVRSVRRVVFFWSSVFLALCVAAGFFYPMSETQKDLLLGFYSLATGGMALGRCAEAYENGKGNGKGDDGGEE